MKPTLPLVLLALTLAACRADEPAPLGRLAFIRNDSLYLQSLPNGPAHLLLAGRGLAQPRWSPSGQWLASHVGRGLRITRSDGSGGQDLAPEVGDFAWAPTDDRIAYIAEGNLVVARAGGLAVVLVEKTRAASVEGVAWCPDGTRLAYALAATPARPGAGAALHVVSARGGQAPVDVPLPPGPVTGAPLLRGWAGNDALLALLPAGDPRAGTVATPGATLWRLAVPRADGSGATSPAPPAGSSRLADPVLPYPDFVAVAPTGDVALVSGAGPETWRNKRVVVVTARGPVSLSGPGRAAISPAWSPDGSRLAWVDMPELPLPGALEAQVSLRERRVLIAAPSGAAKPATLPGPTARQEYPRWSRDARQLLFVGIDSAGVASVWLGAPGETARMVAGLEPPPDGRGWSDVAGHFAWADLLDYWPGPPARH